MSDEQIKELLTWLQSEADKSRTYSERVAFLHTIRKINDMKGT